jgi:acyl-coenzyme A thioesterase PaaI-like protein
MDDFTLADGDVSASFRPRSDYRGAGTSLHGGIAATALDEILVWAGLLAEHVMTVTGRMEIRYRKPVEVTEPLTVRARVDERNGRRLQVSGELLGNDEVRVEASGLYLVTSSLKDLGVLGDSDGDHAGVEM